MSEFKLKNYSTSVAAEKSILEIEKLLSVFGGAKEKCKTAIVLEGDLHQFNFKSEYFDVIICTEVIEHIGDYKSAITEMKRLLKKNGLLILSFPNETNLIISRFVLGKKPARLPVHLNSFYPKEMEKLVRLKLLRQDIIPFGLPFKMGLVCVMMFQK